MKELVIKTAKGERKIGKGNPVFIIAEMSGNHNHSLERAKEIVDAAAQSGADAIKLQTYTPDTMTIDCDKEYFQVKVNKAWKGKTLYNLYKEAYTPWEWHSELKKHAESKGLIFFSTPFDETAVDFLEKLNVQLYKVASFEINHIPLLKKIGQTRKPVILSRGLASEDEISIAIKTLKEFGCPEIMVLHCVSSYPAKPEQMNLSTIPDIEKRFNVLSGLSDHTLGINTSISAVALGASLIEKHFTLSRNDGGPDAEFSLEPKELKNLVESIREVEKAIGTPTYKIGDKEKENLVFKRSIFVVEDIHIGGVFTEKNIRIIRPGNGLSPAKYEKVLGKRSKKDLKRGTPLSDWMVEYD